MYLLYKQHQNENWFKIITFCLSIWVKTIIATELVVGNEATWDNKKNQPKSFVLKKILNKKKSFRIFSYFRKLIHEINFIVLGSLKYLNIWSRIFKISKKSQKLFSYMINNNFSYNFINNFSERFLLRSCWY